MLRLLADENFNRQIVSGMRARLPELDVVRVQDVGLHAAKDPAVLAWAAETERIVLTHDVNTMTGYAYERVAAGERMPGVFHVPLWVSVGRAIEDLLLLAECSKEDEWEGQVRHLPL
jgi:hypothetical protein